MCKAHKALELYPEAVQATVNKHKHIKHGNHRYKQCEEEASLKQCSQCGVKKSLNSYPERTQAMVKKHRDVQHGNHLCTECAEKA